MFVWPSKQTGGSDCLFGGMRWYGGVQWRHGEMPIQAFKGVGGGTPGAVQ